MCLQSRRQAHNLHKLTHMQLLHLSILFPDSIKEECTTTLGSSATMPHYTFNYYTLHAACVLAAGGWGGVEVYSIAVVEWVLQRPWQRTVSAYSRESATHTWCGSSGH